MERNIKFVGFKEEYASKIGEIAVDAWTPIRASFKQILGEELYDAFYTGWQAKKIANVINEMKGERAFVVLVDGQVAGFISYIVNKDTKSGDICDNAISTDFRGLGLGKKMYDFILTKMKDEGLEYAQVTTGLDDGHAPARRAYEKAGFTVGLPSICYFKKLD